MAGSRVTCSNVNCESLFLRSHIFGRLPHAHILIILRDKILSCRHIDDVVSAEIPDPVADPELHLLVTGHMLHPLCDVCEDYGCRHDKNGAVCPCVRHYPKDMCRETAIIPDGYPMYMRRGRFQATVRGGRIISDNWVVPYNAYLLRRYRSHINVEVRKSLNTYNSTHV
jgi:hypothetical protein